MRRPRLAIVSFVGTLLCVTSALFADPIDQDGSRSKHDLDLRFHDEFRSYDGSANNAVHADWGSTSVPLLRHMVDPHYADGSGIPDDATMPSPRAVSNAVVTQSSAVLNGAGVSDFFWQWGQFLDHDLDLTPAMVPFEAFHIAVPAGDPDFDPNGSGTVVIPLDRSIYSMVDGVRQQMNQITAYIDAGNVYGSDASRANELRTLDGSGLLKTSEGRLLPLNVNGYENAPNADPNFFLAGDVRANEQVGLTALHTLFVREHNWVVRWLKRQAPHWTGEQLYQTARAIVGAEMQVITYREFLPQLLGPDALGPYEGYQPEVNAGIDNAFSTAAYRLGHSMVSDVLLRLKHNGQPISEGNLSLAQSFFAPDRIRLEGGIEPLLRGLAAQPAQEIDPFIVDGLRNFLFGPPGAGGFDLAALNIQRGRDHGMKRYNDCRAAVGLTPRASFAEVSDNIDIQNRLAAAYADVDDIDLWVGGLAEDHVPGAMVGELFHTLLTDQFQRLRAGDRFWYENDFKPSMVQWLESQTLATIIRRNTNIGKEIHDQVLVVPPVQLAASNPIHGGNGSGADFANRTRWTSVYPNPGRSESGVWLQIPMEKRYGTLEVGVYDVRGRRVRAFRDVPVSRASSATVHWDGRTTDGRFARSGVYFMQVRADNKTYRRRVLLIR